MIKITKVTGNSLSPFFLPGDFVVLTTNPKTRSNLTQVDVIVFDHPDFGSLIKFVKENNHREKTLIVQGSNPESISSHKLGPIPYSAIHGKVIFSIKQRRPSSHR